MKRNRSLIKEAKINAIKNTTKADQVLLSAA